MLFSFLLPCTFITTGSNKNLTRYIYICIQQCWSHCYNHTQLPIYSMYILPRCNCLAWTDHFLFIFGTEKGSGLVFLQVLLILIPPLSVNTMLNKNSLAVKKVRGQSEATMAISDQNL